MSLLIGNKCSSEFLFYTDGTAYYGAYFYIYGRHCNPHLVSKSQAGKCGNMVKEAFSVQCAPDCVDYLVSALCSKVNVFLTVFMSFEYPSPRME